MMVICSFSNYKRDRYTYHAFMLNAKSCLTLATTWTVALYVLLFMGFSSQEYWSGLPFPLPGGLLNSGLPPGKPTYTVVVV